MKEVTAIITCEITVIQKHDREKTFLSEAEHAEQIKNKLKVDHVNVLNLQHFIRDLPSQSDTEVVETP